VRAKLEGLIKEEKLIEDILDLSIFEEVYVDEEA
jgi:hypothetical protein